MSLNMAKLNCDMFQVTVEFDEKQIKKKDLFADIGADKADKFFVYHYGTKNADIEEHAHLILDLDGKDSTARLTYHKGNAEIEDVREPHLEDFAKWLGAFFKKKNLPAKVTAIYVFPKTDFSVAIPLGFPVMVKDKLLKGVTVSGYELNFPEKSEIKHMIISEKSEIFLAVLNASVVTNLAEFEIYTEIEKYSKYGEPFLDKKVNDEL